MEEEKTIKEKLAELEELKKSKRVKKKFRMPIRGKLGNAKLRRGFATIMVINENNTAEFTRQKIVDSTIKLDDTFHAVDNDDVLSYKGKPLFIIPKKSKNPINPNNSLDNTTYGQKHIMSRMMNETIKFGKKMGIGMSIGMLIIVGVIVYALFAG